VGPKIALKIFLSKTPKIASSDFDNEDKDMNKILSGNMWAVYAEYPQPHCVDVKNTIFKVSLRVNVCKMYQRAHAAGVYWCLLCARVCVLSQYHPLQRYSVSFVGMSKGCSAIVLRVELSMKRTA
jgi:hypothetical protein